MIDFLISFLATIVLENIAIFLNERFLLLKRNLKMERLLKNNMMKRCKRLIKERWIRLQNERILPDLFLWIKNGRQ
jgi:hypothetical protein